jgi:hypothetical protein
MRNLLKNKWGRIGLMLVACFIVHGFIAASSYAETCCLCSDGIYVAQGASTCATVCSGPGYTGTSYTLHPGSTCNTECSDAAGYCFVLNQRLCDQESRKENTCVADYNLPNTRICGPAGGFGSFSFPSTTEENGWSACADAPTADDCNLGTTYDSWNNTTNKTNTDDDDYCTPTPYAQ